MFPPDLEVEPTGFSNLVTNFQRGPSSNEGSVQVASSIENSIISIYVV